MKSDERNMRVRIVSGSVIISVTAIAALLSSYLFALLSLVVAVISCYELFKIAQKGGYSPQWGVGIGFTALLIVLNFVLLELQSFEVAISNVGLVSLFALPMIVCICVTVELLRGMDKPLVNSAITLFGVAYIGLPISLLTLIPRLMNGGEWSGATMLAYFFLIWANDSFAYLFGVTMGRRPLLSRISPKKSVEGFVGGVVGTIVIALVAAWILGGNLYVWAGLGLIVSLSAVVGDLVQSMIKRSVNEKDSGSIIPGHGGFWDRYDSLIYSVSPATLYLYILTLLKVW